MNTPLSSLFFSFIKFWTFVQFFLIAFIASCSIFFKKIHFFLNRRKKVIRNNIRLTLIEHLEENKKLVFTTKCPAKDLIVVMSEMNQEYNTPTWEKLKLQLCNEYLVPEARKWAFSSHWHVRLLAVRCFLIFADEQNERSILHLLKDKIPLIKYAASYCAANLATLNCAEAIIAEMDHSDRFLRHTFVDAISRGNSKIYEHVESVLKKARNPYTKLSCLEILSLKMHSNISEYAKQSLYDPHKNLRIAAIRALGHFPCKENQELLLPLLKETDWEIRAIAVNVLGRLDAKDAIPQIQLMLQDKIWWVRMNAAIALKRMGSIGEEVLIAQDPKVDRFAFEIAQYVLPMNIKKFDDTQ